jgi:hypothetical protein
MLEKVSWIEQVNFMKRFFKYKIIIPLYEGVMYGGDKSKVKIHFFKSKKEKAQFWKLYRKHIGVK